jgi:hypothetical protein
VACLLSSHQAARTEYRSRNFSQYRSGVTDRSHSVTTHDQPPCRDDPQTAHLGRSGCREWLTPAVAISPWTLRSVRIGYRGVTQSLVRPSWRWRCTGKTRPSCVACGYPVVGVLRAAERITWMPRRRRLGRRPAGAGMAASTRSSMSLRSSHRNVRGTQHVADVDHLRRGQARARCNRRGCRRSAPAGLRAV